MRKPEDGKKVYDNIEIPEELNNVVKDAIHSMDKGKSIKKASYAQCRKDLQVLWHSRGRAARMHDNRPEHK